jgi:hypothetical protein
VQLGEVLTLRGSDGDARRAVDLLRRGRDLAGELGMTALIRPVAPRPMNGACDPTATAGCCGPDPNTPA